MSIAPAQPAQLALPFSLRDAVSVSRAASILGVSRNTVYLMLHEGLIQSTKRGDLGPHLIRYASLVQYCDELRQTFNLPDRRPPISNPLFRHQDRDILPFPLDQTIDVETVMNALQLEKSRVIEMANRMDFQAYQLAPGARTWRIYRPSVEAILQRMHERMVKPRPTRYSWWGT